MSNSIEQSNENKFTMILKSAMNLPGVQINRNTFLRKELSVYYPPEIVELAISQNPAIAGITVEELEKISKACIEYETKKVSLISAVAGVPGGFGMLGTVPADLVQYFGHIIRILQKLAYLYGWDELYNSNGEFDDDTTDKLILFIGVMYGVNVANSAVKKIAQNAAMKVEKELGNKALTKGVIYPAVKKISQIVGMKMTKEIFAKSVSKAVPVFGGALSGGMTYYTFKPSANNLKNRLKQLQPASTDFYKMKQQYIEDTEFTEIEEF